jgi:hypothetical protein
VILGEEMTDIVPFEIADTTSRFLVSTWRLEHRSDLHCVRFVREVIYLTGCSLDLCSWTGIKEVSSNLISHLLHHPPDLGSSSSKQQP